MNRSRLSALILGSPDPLSMGLASGWLRAGNIIKGIWFPKRAVGTFQMQRDIAWTNSAPGVSMHGICKRIGLIPLAIPKLMEWDDATAEIKALAPDIILSLMFTDRIPPNILEAFPRRVFNLHPSLLPAYRGAAPIFNMLWDQTIDRYSGMTLHLVDENFDTGPILAQSPVSFDLNIRLGTYFMELAKSGTRLLENAIIDNLEGKLRAVVQPTGVWPQSLWKPGEPKLSSSMTAAEIKWLSSTIPQIAPLKIVDQRDDLLISGFIKDLGSPTGGPVQIENNTLAMDFHDKRIVLKIAAT